MSERGDISVDWVSSPRILTVAWGAAGDELTIQDLVDTCRSLEDDLDNLDDKRLIDAAGKFDLGSGKMTIVAVRLRNAKLKFEGPGSEPWTLCKVSGGDLIAVDSLGDPIEPIEPSPYVTVQIAQATTGMLLPGEGQWTTGEQKQIRDSLGVDGEKTTATGGQVQTIKDKTNNLPTDPASNSNVNTQIASLNDLDKGAVQDAMTDQGYTTTRAPNLDNLDEAISDIPENVDTQLSSTHGEDSWEGSADVDAIADAVLDEPVAQHLQTGTLGAIINAINNNIALIKKIETGRWRIANNKMIIYGPDKKTVLLQFSLKGPSGKATMPPAASKVFERVPI